MACGEEMLGPLVAVTDELSTAVKMADVTRGEFDVIDRAHAAIKAAEAVGIAQPDEGGGATSTGEGGVARASDYPARGAVSSTRFQPEAVGFEKYTGPSP